MRLAGFTSHVAPRPASRNATGGPGASSASATLKTRTARGFLAWSGTTAALLAMLLASGTHWVALQAFAFGSMMVRYSQSAPLSQAIADTFDGRHPCPLCHAVQEGRQQEERQRPSLGLQNRLEPALLHRSFQAQRPILAPFELPALRLTAWHSRPSPPPKPPPRSAVHA